MEIQITRTYHARGTNGLLCINGKPTCYTIELPWRNNAPRISCIPEGRYEVVKRYSPRFKNHLVVCDVAGRSLILIHPANDALKELNGCIAPVTALTGIGRGSESKKAMDRLLSIVYAALKR